MEEQKNKLNQQIKIADNLAGAEYSNMMQVNHNREEFHLIFLNVMGPSGRVSGKIITSPGHFKRMVNAIHDNLKKYEDKFGTIEEVDLPGKEIGFRENK